MTTLELFVLSCLGLVAAAVVVAYFVARLELDDDIQNPWERFE